MDRVMANAALGEKVGCGVSDPTDRPRTGSLRRSCEACRALKARCVVDPSTPQQSRCCQRCASNGLDCVFEEAIARPKRARPAARARVKDVEEKLDSLIALIAARNGSKPTEPMISPPEWPPSSTTTVSDAQLESLLQSAQAPLQGFQGFNLPITPPGSELAVTALDVFSKGIISHDTAQRLVSLFTANTASFPFVVLASHMTVDYMRRERPFLLLAIMVATSDSPLQELLAREFRQMLAQNVIVDGEKNIDVIQGLVVFCVWHHRCFSPAHHQLYQLTQLAVSMAVDLGLPQLSQISAMELQKTGFSSSRGHNPQYWDELERMRTYLGTYYVSHCISISLRKPTHLKHSRRLEEAAKLISSLDQTESDVLLPYHIRLQKFAEEIEKVFQYNDPDGMGDFDGVKIYSMVRSFERKLAELKDALPPEIWENPCVQLEMAFLHIYINEIGLQIAPGHGNDGTCGCNWCGSTYRTEILVSCIRAAQRYIDLYLSFRDDQLRSLNVMEVGRHLYCVLILGRVVVRQDTHDLDSLMLRDLAEARTYLEKSERRMEQLVTVMDGVKEKKDAFWQLKQIFSQALIWYRVYQEKEPLSIDKGVWREDCGIGSNRIDLNFETVLSMGPELTEKRPTEDVVQQQATPPGVDSAWVGDPDLLWSSLNFTPQANWFEL